jgi:penicillin-binding protein A
MSGRARGRATGGAPAGAPATPPRNGMDRRIGRLGGFLLLCYLALFVQLNRVQVFSQRELSEHPANTRAIVRDFDRDRGAIVTADGVLLARSVPTPEGSDFDLLREYPEGELFGHVTGFFSFQFGATGIEEAYNDKLAGDTLEQNLRSFEHIFESKANTGDVVLTIRKDAQVAARDALGEQEGAVVAIDPRDGDVLALWGFPSYDPNLLSGHDLTAVDAFRDALLEDPRNPLRSEAFQERYFPGSTFKVVTASAGIEDGGVTPEQPVYPDERSFTPPQTTRPLSNFGGNSCGGALFEILARSCNSSFARMAVDTGPEAMVERAEAFGFNEEPPLDLPATVASAFPTDFTENIPKLAQAGIGQGDVSASPLQMALVAAAIANGGDVPKPHLMAEIHELDGDTIESFDEGTWRDAIDGDTAELMREAMKGVVADGTAEALAIPGYEVGGKTGTAQLGTDPPSSHAWIIGFAGLPGEEPSVAVAVLVKAQPGVSEITGGTVAAPIARQVMEVILAAQAAEDGDDDGD